MKQIILALASLAIITSINSCKNGGGAKSFTALKPGIEYQIFSKGTSKTLVKSGDIIRLHIKQKLGDTIFSSTYETDPNGNSGPQLQQVFVDSTHQAFNPLEVFTKMYEGDSVVIKLSVDSTMGKSAPPPFYKKGDQYIVYAKIVNVLSKSEVDSLNSVQAKRKEGQQQDRAKMMEEMQKKQRENAVKLGPIEDAKIKEYIAAKGIKATKTASGLYYAITTPGTGANATSGKTVNMKYTGMNLDGSKFDSNTDPAFGHVQPFEFPLGGGQVIQGWDEGIAYFNKGAKGILIIPSFMAYGENPPPGDKIKKNAILTFDVEVVDIK